MKMYCLKGSTKDELNKTKESFSGIIGNLMSWSSNVPKDIHTCCSSTQINMDTEIKTKWTEKKDTKFAEPMLKQRIREKNFTAISVCA